jgi:general secretion pathway protein I
MTGLSATRRAPGRARGFTLLEVMIALAILAVSLVVLLGLRNRDVQLQTYARDLTRATLLARQMAATVDAEGTPELGYVAGDFGQDHPGFSWQRQVTPFMAELIGDRVREVRVSVIWGPTDDPQAPPEGRVDLSRFVEVKNGK